MLLDIINKYLIKMSRNFLCKKMLSTYDDDMLSFGKSGEVKLNFNKNISKIASLKLIKRHDLDINMDRFVSSHEVLILI